MTFFTTQCTGNSVTSVTVFCMQFLRSTLELVLPKLRTQSCLPILSTFNHNSVLFPVLMGLFVALELVLVGFEVIVKASF